MRQQREQLPSTFSGTIFYFYNYSLQNHKAIIENNGEQLPSPTVGEYLRGKKT
jgi:hypothetical protein